MDSGWTALCLKRIPPEEWLGSVKATGGHGMQSDSGLSPVFQSKDGLALHARQMFKGQIYSHQSHG